MSSSRLHHNTATTSWRRPRRLVVLAVLGSVAIAAGLAIGLTVTDREGVVSPATGGPHDHSDGSLPAGYRLTGEIGPMGGQVLETPGTRTGAASAGGVTVTDGADITMGHVPLAYAVNPTWHLRNTTANTLTLGPPRVEVVKGCCPAEPLLGRASLAPGEETTLEFPTQMHPGMDGDHLFRLTVPVSGASDPLVVSVAGDFS